MATLLINDDVQPIIQVMNKVKRSKTHKLPRQREYESLLTFKPDTWLIDLVQFHAANTPVWYVFFIHANSRYLIIRDGSTLVINDDAVELPENRKARVKTNAFLPILNEIVKNHNVKYIMGDSEKAFWSNSSMRFYREHNIKVFPVNVKKDGHLRMSVLDRCVRTIRDYAFNAEITAFTSNVIKQLAVIYNNSKNRDLTDILSKTRWAKSEISPSDIFKRPSLERVIIAILTERNKEHARKTKNFIIPDGTEVIVKDIHNKRQQCFTGKWIVQSHKGQSYNVSNGTKIMNVARCYIKVLSP